MVLARMSLTSPVRLVIKNSCINSIASPNVDVIPNVTIKRVVYAAKG